MDSQWLAKECSIQMTIIGREGELGEGVLILFNLIFTKGSNSSQKRSVPLLVSFDLGSDISTTSNVRPPRAAVFDDELLFSVDIGAGSLGSDVALFTVQLPKSHTAI